MPCWYAVRTRSNFEKTAAGEMAARGIEHYLPAVTVLSQWKDRRKNIDRPLFPGYLFARFEDTPEARTAVLKSRGAFSILGGGGCIEPVPPGEIEAVRRLLASQERCTVHPLLKEGCPVRVIRGPLAGIDGLLVRISNRSRLVVSVELLSQSVSAEVDAGAVERVERRCTRI